MTFEELMDRSERLHDAIDMTLATTTPYPGVRHSTAMAACAVALEHGRGFHSLVRVGCPTSATALLRIQFEALARATWLLYCASEPDIQKLAGPIDEQSQKLASKLPMLSEMIAKIEQHAPAEVAKMLVRFKTLSAGPMNSFVHGGIHPLRRRADGFPLQLLDQIVRSCNGLSTICAMLAAINTGDPRIVAGIKEMQTRFLEILPEGQTES